MITKKPVFSFSRSIGLLSLGAAAFLFAACDSGNDTGTFGAPDRFAEDPAADQESAPPMEGAVGGADPTDDTNPTAEQSGQSGESTQQEVEVTTEPPATSQPQGADQQ